MDEVYLMTKNESDVPLVTKTEDGLLSLTSEGKEALRPIVTDVDSQVYAFYSSLDTEKVAAAMARLSRNPNDLRTILASEFITNEDGSDSLLRRVVTDFGDDSVMQLDNLQLVFEGVSNLASKVIERGRLAAYLEQSTRYLRFDRRDEYGKYRYVTPDGLDDKTSELYVQHIDAIFDIYSDLYQKVRHHIETTSSVPEQERDAAWRTACHAQACDSIRGLLPAATKTTVGVSGSTQAIYNMILHMESESMPEYRRLGSMALEASRMVKPVFFERIDMPDRGGLISDNKLLTRSATRQLAHEFIEAHANIEQKTGANVSLIAIEGSENDLIAKILTDSSSYPLESMQELVLSLSDDEKQTILDAYVGDRFNRRVKPGRAFEMPHYTFEIQCDFGAFRDIQRHRMVDALEWQQLQPHLGHDRPKIIDTIGETDAYEKAFELSQQTYQLMIDNGYEEEAQYATLFGHIMRFNFKINARSLFHSAELRTTPQGHPSYRAIYQQMAEKVGDVHPFIYRYMTHLNKGEDLELARLGAERAKQRRVALLHEVKDNEAHSLENG